MKKDYYLGLDIGTNSVGWAVTDEQYNLCKFRNKEMWGIRLFEDAQTAAERRTKRAGRRRLQRRKERIRLLQELFAEEIAKLDDTFFIRLNESSKYVEDKTTSFKHPLFAGEDYSESQYYKDYPTIFHLRKELIENTNKHDPRLVYLALHNMLKHRGHFLIEGNLNNATDFGPTFDAMIQSFESNSDLNIYVNKDNYKKIADILSNKRIAKSVKAKDIKEFIEISSPDSMDFDEKAKKVALDALSKLLVGLKGDIAKLFNEEFSDLENTSINVSEAIFEEKIRDEVASVAPDIAFILDNIKAVYDWSVLVDILKGEKYISYAKVAEYDKHKSDLKRLKAFVREYCSDETFKKIFSSKKEKVSYSAYVGSANSSNEKNPMAICSDEEFFKLLKKVIEGSTCDKEDAEYTYLMEEIENNTLLPKQRTKHNSVIPKQVNEAELEAILKNASSYLEFLNVKGDDGTTVAEKISMIFNYKIPYYVGPLSYKNQNGKSNTWIVRKEGQEGKILPWTFKDIVDEEASNEAFIRRMTNKCTYLLNEDVLAKNTLIYRKFMVLNELNNLKIRGEEIPVELKQELYHELFENKSRVTGKAVCDYLKQYDGTLTKDDLSGFDQDFNSALTSYLDFRKKVFGDRINEYKIQEIVDNCINWITIYGNDKTMLKKVIKKNYADVLTDEEINNIGKLSYSGWGNFSRKFLCEIEGTNKTDGQVYTILEALWETNCNLMQLLSNDFTFSDEIKNINAEAAGEIGKITYDSVVDNLYISPANKRAVWQTIQIAEEVKKVMKGEPKRIFIEMARGATKEQKQRGRTVTRKQQLIDLYKNCEKDGREEWLTRIEKHDEREFNSKKLFLYYTQMGRCAYSGEPIDLDALMGNNSAWDRDHIFPQSKIKDDSLDNMVLAKKVLNEKKDNRTIPGDWQAKMEPIWKDWLDKKLISKKKYDRLTKKGDFSEEELAGFIERQIVETRQATKAVKDVFERIYQESKVVCVKASLASDFRKKPLNCLKSRLLNDYHHAKDAYLNIVVGNVYDAKFTSNPRQWIRKNRDTNYSLNRVFYYDVYRGDELVWKAPNYENKKAVKNSDGDISTGSIDVVRKTMNQNNILYTEYTYCGKGQLFDETIAKKDDNPRIPLKKDLDVNKYGGYKSAKTSYFVLIEFDGNKGERTRKVLGIPTYIANKQIHDENAVHDYLSMECGYENVEILKDHIKKNALLIVNGFPMRIRGENEITISFKGNLQLLLNEQDCETVRCIEKILTDEQPYEVVKNFDGIGDEELIRLFDSLIVKAVEGPYRNRPANQGGVAASKRGDFIALTTLDKCKLINNLLIMFSTKATNAFDLSLIGKGQKAGNMAVSKNTVGNSTLIFINQSVTGLFETREKY